VLPGGDMPDADFAAYLPALAGRYPRISPGLVRRYARTYGTRAERILRDARTTADLGEEVLPGLYAREIDYLRREEWAESAADMLYRRTKLALHVPANGPELLDDWLRRHPWPGAVGGPL
jgi:glycerol-3-phosphate dehydrogenase